MEEIYKELFSQEQQEFLQSFRIETIKSDRFHIFRENYDVKIFYRKKVQIYKALAFLLEKKELNTIDFTFADDFPLSFMADYSRNRVHTVPAIKKVLKYLALLGYERFFMYLEDLYPIKYDAYFSRMRGAYSSVEIKEIVQFANRIGIEVVPAIQTLAHLNGYFKWPHTSEINDCEDILLCGNEKSYAFIESCIASVKEMFMTDKVLIGFDEAHLLGAGRYPDKTVSKKDIFYNHLEKVRQICEKYELKIYLWTDGIFSVENMPYFSEGKEFVFDEGTKKRLQGLNLIYWNYGCENEELYQKMFLKHKTLSEKVVSGNSTASPNSFSPFNKLAFRYVSSSMHAAKKFGISEYHLCFWNDDGGENDLFNSLPVLAYASDIAYYDDYSEQRADEVCRALFCTPLRSFFALDLANRPFIDIEKYDKTEPAFNFVNPGKYLFYCDLLLNVCEHHVYSYYPKTYKRNAEIIKKAERGNQFERAFRIQETLCRFLSKKTEIILLIREGYKEKDRQKIRKAAQKIDLLLRQAERFFEFYKAQWDANSKVFGWEVIDIRFGGMVRRLKSAKQRLLLYAEGCLQNLEELEQEDLPYNRDSAGYMEELSFMKYSQIVSPNNL